MQKLFDITCPECFHVEVDVFAERIEDLALPCPECHDGTMEWKPSYGSRDVRDEFYDPGLDMKFTSLIAMEREAKRRGKTQMTTKEWESMPRLSTEERIARNRPDLQEAIRKSTYRLKYGYKDHPDVKD